MGKADLHIHTTAGDGLLDPRDVAEYVATETDLNVFAIADHDTFEGAWQAWRWLQAHPRLRVEMLWGVEITAAWFKHLLFYWPDRPPQRLPRRFLSPSRLIAEMAETGAVCIAAHPTNPFSINGRDLRGLVARGCAPAGMEVCSPVLGRGRETQLRALARRLGLASVGNSDTHGMLQTIGAGLTYFHGFSRYDLLRALQEGTTDAGWGPVPVTPLWVLARQILRAWVGNPGLLQRRR